MNLNQVTVEVSDIGRSVAFYRRLGLELIVLSEHYARLACPGGATFSVHLAAQPSTGGALIYFECEDLGRALRGACGRWRGVRVATR